MSFYIAFFPFFTLLPSLKSIYRVFSKISKKRYLSFLRYEITLGTDEFSMRP